MTAQNCEENMGDEMQENTAFLMEHAIGAALRAGGEIMNVYSGFFEVELKDDRSPLTEADMRAHRVIAGALSTLGLPVLSEEGRSIPFAERRDWKRFWMVDPLDGTKEFVKRNGEFTVNIALIENGRSVAGVIYAPVLRALYFGWEGGAAFKCTVDPEMDISTISISALKACSAKLPLSERKGPFKVVGSRSHKSAETEAYFADLEQKHGPLEMRAMGSSLKICLVAEGAADMYPRFAPTMEWDTAAGHAIANAAGKEIIDYQTGKQMRYNKENLLNNWFIVS